LFCFSYNSRCTDLFMFRIGSQLGCRCAGLCTNSVKGNCLPSMACLLLDQHEQEKDRTVNPKRR
jgi:hypothetical protein